jgi:rRNA maturation protein Nop10
MSDDLAAEARERTREDVRDIFARRTEVPLRSCPHCGEQARTRDERCPACGRSYFAKPARFSVRTRRTLQAAGAVAVAIVAVLVIVTLTNQAHDNKARTRAQQRAAAAAERARLAREQRPHHAVASALRDGDHAAPAAARLRRRQALVRRLEASITADARGRVARHELSARAVTATRCHPLINGARGDELDLRRALGRYACEAAVGKASNEGVTSTLGLPFVGTVDFARGRLTWCKDNPVSASDVKQALAFVRLARECTAARGPAFGSGYLIEPRR